jgi:hypothetical protein
VIAGRDDVGSGLKKFVGDGSCDAETAGGVLAIGDDEIEFEPVS